MNAIGTEFEPAATTRRPHWPDLPEPAAGRARPLIARALIRAATGRLPIRVELPDGAVFGAGGQGTPTVEVRDVDAFFGRIGTGTAGFAESYMAGDWDCDDLPGLFSILAGHVHHLLPAPLRALRRLYVPRKPAEEDDTVEGARRNIARHYDLSNDFFGLFLDPTMTYSSALFGPGDDLERAQIRKIDRLLDLTGTGPGTRLLEIGTGWGALALRAAGRGATVTTVTNSAAQWQLARSRATDAGLTDRIEARLCDYREITGVYDAVVSVEMVEAVGLSYLPGYFALIDRVLVRDGRAAVQAITMPHQQLVATAGGQSWIHQYIFPGGQIPSRQVLDHALAGTSLRISSEFAMGPHYASTLAWWRDQFAKAESEVLRLGFGPAFVRMWDLYLAYSCGGFLAGYLNVWQLGLRRPGEHRQARVGRISTKLR
ncbi:MAG TPA: cyclopropane-fatty-acyl-phospholipid synthase family protein [Streptosporangiaceae bacterium]|nr:cyclopropane-fatty-acyl-phospholipid synthase family protein [Streptosporangiaceae bacterium]